MGLIKGFDLVSASDALSDLRVLMLVAALAPFGEVDGEGDEEFPDATPVTVQFGRTTNHSLTLGDFRRARAAMIAESERAGA